MIVECPECGTKNSIVEKLHPEKTYRCGTCNALITILQTNDTPANLATPNTATKKVSKQSKNTSGQGKLAAMPKEIQGWTWGAFLLNWIWSISNNVWIGLLALIPVVNIVILITLGMKGNEWAWQNKRWDSIADFKEIQARWRDVGIRLFMLIGFALLVWFVWWLFVEYPR